MPSYRYFTTDLLTGNVLGELPLYGVYCDKAIKAAGNFNGTYRLETGIEDDVELLTSSMPMRTAIYMEREGTIIWGGIIWSRTFESNAKTVQLSAQTFESYISRVAIKKNFIRKQIDQLRIAKDLIDDMQSNPRSNIGIDTSQMAVLSDVKRDIAIPFYDYKYYADALAEISDGDNGFDWYIQVTNGAFTDQPEKRLIVGSPNIVYGDINNAAFYEYPGSIDQFYWPESGSKSGTDFILLGNGTGSNMLQSVSTWSGAAGYPEIDQIVSRKDIANQTTLNAIAQSTAEGYGAAINNPTITLKSDADPGFEGWNDLGAYYKFNLESPRFILEGGSVEAVRRMLGWTLTPASSESTEIVKLILEGEEEGDG